MGAPSSGSEPGLAGGRPLACSLGAGMAALLLWAGARRGVAVPGGLGTSADTLVQGFGLLAMALFAWAFVTSVRAARRRGAGPARGTGLPRARLAGLALAAAQVLLLATLPRSPAAGHGASMAAPRGAGGRDAARAGDRALRRLELRVHGMSCGGCARSLERQLRATRGVVRARVRFRDARAVVELRPGEVSPEALVAVCRRAGFRAEIVEAGGARDATARP